MKVEEMLVEAIEGENVEKAVHAIVRAQVWAAEFVRARAELQRARPERKPSSKAAAKMADAAAKAYCETTEAHWPECDETP